MDQALDPERDEVLLNSNLPPESVKRIIGDRPIHALANPRPDQGPFYATAVRAARGEVIAFLDDDDRWTAGRIAAVRERFARSPSLSYFHNEQRRIDPSGAIIADVPATLRLSRRDLGTELAVDGPVPPRELQRLMQGAAFFNLSSTCVRAAAVGPFLPYLDRITTSDDSFFFYAALLSGGGFLLDPRPWTEYRVHSANLSRQWDAATMGSREQEWPRRAVHSHTVLLEMARAHGRPGVARCVERDLAMMRLLEDVGREPPSRRASGAHLIDLLRRLSIGYLPLNLGFAALGCSEVLSPSLGQFVHRRLRK